MVRPTAAGGKGKGFAAVKQNRGVPDDSVVEAQQGTQWCDRHTLHPLLKLRGR